MRLTVYVGKYIPRTIQQKQCRRLILYMYILTKNLIDITAEKNMSSNVHKREIYPNAIQVNLFLILFLLIQCYIHDIYVDRNFILLFNYLYCSALLNSRTIGKEQFSKKSRE